MQSVRLPSWMRIERDILFLPMRRFRPERAGGRLAALLRQSRLRILFLRSRLRPVDPGGNSCTVASHCPNAPLSDRSEVETIRLRPKARHYRGRMSRWTGADEAEYRWVLDGPLAVAGPDLERLRRKINRQEAAILALRRKHRVNAERPRRFDW